MPTHGSEDEDRATARQQKHEARMAFYASEKERVEAVAAERQKKHEARMVRFDQQLEREQAKTRRLIEEQRVRLAAGANRTPIEPAPVRVGRQAIIGNPAKERIGVLLVTVGVLSILGLGAWAAKASGERDRQAASEAHPDPFTVVGTVTGPATIPVDGPCQIRRTGNEAPISLATTVTVYYNQPDLTTGATSAGTVDSAGNCVIPFRVPNITVHGTKSYYLRFDGETVKSMNPWRDAPAGVLTVNLVVSDIGLLSALGDDGI